MIALQKVVVDIRLSEYLAQMFQRAVWKHGLMQRVTESYFGTTLECTHLP